jgi:hypothetical protein
LRNNLATPVIALQLNIWYGQAVQGNNLGDVVLADACFSISNSYPAGVITLQDLLDYVNQYLAGLIADQPGLAGTLTSDISDINEYYHECTVSEVDPCTSETPVLGVDNNDGEIEDNFNLTEFSTAKVNTDNFKFYPNPATDEVTFIWNMEEDQQNDLRLINMNGAVVYQRTWQSYKGENRFTLLVSNLKPGLYIIQFSGKDGIRTEKLIKAQE